MLSVEQVRKIYIDLYRSSDTLMMAGINPPDMISGALDFLALILGDDCPTGAEILKDGE